MARYTVNHGGVDDVYAQLNRSTNDIVSVLRQLENTAKSTLAYWEGHAQAAYQAAQLEWNSAAQTMVTQLGSKATTLNLINQNYRESDQRASRMLR